MIRNEVLREFDEQCKVAFAERTRALRRELAQLKESMGGAIHGSRAVIQFTEAGRDELQLRARLGWQELIRILSAMGVSPSDDAAVEIGNLMTNLIESQRLVLQELVEEQVALTRVNIRFTDEIDVVAEALKTKYESEARILIGSLRNQKAQGLEAMVFNFNAPVGFVQTGANSVANVDQSVTVHRDQIREAINAVSNVLASDPGVAAEVSISAGEIIVDTRRELDKPAPNGPKVVALLKGLSELIQVSAAAQPAYLALKAVLNSIGFPAP